MAFERKFEATRLYASKVICRSNQLAGYIMPLIIGASLRESTDFARENYYRPVLEN